MGVDVRHWFSILQQELEVRLKMSANSGMLVYVSLKRWKVAW